MAEKMGIGNSVLSKGLFRRLGTFPSGMPLYFSNTVVPVTEVNRKSSYITMLPDVAVTGTGLVYIGEVSMGYRVVSGMIEVLKTSGTWTFDSILVYNKDGDSWMGLFYAATSTFKHLDFSNGLIIDEGWKLYLKVDTFSSAGAFTYSALSSQELV